MQHDNINYCPELTRNRQFLLLTFLPVYFIVAGFFLQPAGEIVQGIVSIVKEPDFLITDYFEIGGIGAAFLNAGILTLISIYMVYQLGMHVSGHTITSVFLMFGFSLFGKNILNIWAILLGVILYAAYHKTHLSRYLYVGFYGTSLSPIITQIRDSFALPFPSQIMLSIITGVIIGFVLPPLSTHTHFAHKGYSLYNVGFAAGIIATVVVSLLRSFGVEIPSRLIWSTGNNEVLGILLVIFFGLMILLASARGGKKAFCAYRELLKNYGVSAPDYVKQYGIWPVMINMGINGLVATGFILAVHGDLNGPTIGSILTIVGFSATGKHIRNMLPIMVGVLIASCTKEWSLNDPSPILALLLSTTLAPIAGEFGILAGILAGFLHSSVALNVGVLYSGMNLYNNGFAGGMVAIFLVPVLQSIRDRRARAKGHISL